MIFMGIFDNATQVMINNKEVQSIKLTSNNAVLYEKGGDNYLLTLTSDKSILSYYDSESATLTATLTNNSSPVSGEKVYFYDGNTTQTTYTGWELVQDEILPGNWFIQIDSDSLSEYISIGETSGTTYYYLWYSNGVAYICDQTEETVTSLQASEGLGLIGSVLYGDSGTLDISQYNINTSYVYFASDITLEYTSFVGVDVTDGNGEASVSYVSKGAGDINIVAECMSLQETYSLIDAVFYDDGVTSPKTATWVNQSNRLQIEVDTTGTTITKNADGWNILYAEGNASSYPFDIGSCIEFDVVSCTNEMRLQFYDGTTGRLQITLPTNATNYHVKVEIGETTITKTVNGVTTTESTSTYINGDFQVNFATNISGASLKFKNFMVYSI